MIRQDSSLKRLMANVGRSNLCISINGYWFEKNKKSNFANISNFGINLFVNKYF